MEAIEVLVERSAERVRLCSPGVGTLTELRRPGSLVAPGEQVGVLVTLGRARSLCAPADVAGRVVSPLRDRVHAPVGYGELVCELAPLRSAELEPAGAQRARARRARPRAARPRRPGASGGAARPRMRRWPSRATR